ncbi:MAG: iron chelate uptake ABC transporter family permease subunit, partial [Halothiobacillaceae bacterium]
GYRRAGWRRAGRGGSLVMLADLLARTLIAPQQLPAGALLALIGAPLFLVLLYREARR